MTWAGWLNTGIAGLYLLTAVGFLGAWGCMWLSSKFRRPAKSWRESMLREENLRVRKVRRVIRG